MLIKFIDPSDQDFGVDPIVPIKISSRGLVGSDLGSFVKRAGHYIANEIKKLTFEPGEVPIHLIALGALEYYGPNRNGDAFDVNTCRKYHHTFKKYAKLYRNHMNKDPSRSYGVVKASLYNEEMHRIELIVALNGNRKIAEKNGGLVADKELQKLASGKEIAVSMACFVPYDVCSICGNKAKSRAEYCRGLDEGGKCPGGGARTKLGTVLEDGRQLFVYNPNPKFFDISHVIKPADRIAYVTSLLDLDELKKQAFSSIMANIEDVNNETNHNPTYIPNSIIPLLVTADTSFLSHLSEVENKIIKSAHLLTSVYSIDPTEIDAICEGIKPVKNNLNYLLSSLTQKNIVLPPKIFCKMAGFSEIEINQVLEYMPGIFNSIIRNNLEGVIAKKANELNLYDFHIPCPSEYDKLFSRFSLDPHKVATRKSINIVKFAAYDIKPRIKAAKLINLIPPAVQKVAAYQYSALKIIFQKNRNPAMLEVALLYNFL